MEQRLEQLAGLVRIPSESSLEVGDPETLVVGEYFVYRVFP
jgi:hypothetical protein